MLHSDHPVIITLFLPYCKIISAKKVKIFWKIRMKFLKKSFFCNSYDPFFKVFGPDRQSGSLRFPERGKPYIFNVFHGFGRRVECNTILHYVALEYSTKPGREIVSLEAAFL